MDGLDHFGGARVAGDSATPRVTAFLSCSVRPGDRPLVDAMQKVLGAYGFECRTIGRNVSKAEQVDDAVKSLVAECDCLIGVATERFEAIDRTAPDRTLSMATPYVLQETSMAFQAGLPWFVFKTPGLTLHGVTNRNIWIEVQRQLSSKGTPRFKCSRSALDAALADLKSKAVAYRQKRWKDRVLSIGAKAVSAVALGGAAVWGWSRAARPECFGTFDYRAPECKGCPYKPDCKAEKNRN